MEALIPSRDAVVQMLKLMVADHKSGDVLLPPHHVPVLGWAIAHLTDDAVDGESARLRDRIERAVDILMGEDDARSTPAPPET
jgi:hypothetical protein